MKYEYHLECFTIGKWLNILIGSREFLRGFLHARRDYRPRLAYRLIRNDGLIIESCDALDDVSVGQIAGFPTAEQYEAAANKAMERVSAIREQEAKKRR